jgi:hypothetical protein
MNSRLPIAGLLVLAATLATAHAGDAVKAKELMTLMRADEVVAGAMKTSLRSKKSGLGLTDAQIACLDAVPHSEFSDAVTKALADGLGDEELASAIAFYRSPAGIRYVKSLVALMQDTRPAETLSDDDAARVRDFADTALGNKLLKQALIPNSNAVADKMAEVSANAIENCGKGSGK